MQGCCFDWSKESFVFFPKVVFVDLNFLLFLFLFPLILIYLIWNQGTPVYWGHFGRHRWFLSFYIFIASCCDRYRLFVFWRRLSCFCGDHELLCNSLKFIIFCFQCFRTTLLFSSALGGDSASIYILYDSEDDCCPLRDLIFQSFTLKSIYLPCQSFFSSTFQLLERWQENVRYFFTAYHERIYLFFLKSYWQFSWETAYILESWEAVFVAWR